MATKKQKREVALAKREQFIKEEAERGLAAQRQAREADEKEREKLRQIAREVNARYEAILSRAWLTEDEG